MLESKEQKYYSQPENQQAVAGYKNSAFFGKEESSFNAAIVFIHVIFPLTPLL